MRLLVVDPDREFREELHNFLLSAGYGPVDVAEDWDAAENRDAGPGRHGAAAETHVVIVAAASPSASRPTVERLRRRRPRTRLIVLIDDDDPAEGKRRQDALVGADFLIKSTYSRHLTYLLEGGDPR